MNKPIFGRPLVGIRPRLVGPLFVALAGAAAASLPASAHDAIARDADKILAAMTDNLEAQPMLSADYDA